MRKAQMFIVTMVFLTGLIFAVQQLLFQYTLIDLSRPLQQTDFYLLSSIGDIFNLTIYGLNCSNLNSREQVLNNLVELDAWLNRQSFGGYSLELMYNAQKKPNLNCTGGAVLILDVEITGADSFTEKTYVYTEAGLV